MSSRLKHAQTSIVFKFSDIFIKINAFGVPLRALYVQGPSNNSHAIYNSLFIKMSRYVASMEGGALRGHILTRFMFLYLQDL